MAMINSYTKRQITYNRFYDWNFERFSSKPDPERPNLFYSITKTKNVLKKLSEEDQKIIDFYYFRRYPQKYIGKCIGMTQGAISIRLAKIRKRLKFHLLFPSLNIDFIYIHFSHEHVNIIKAMIDTASITHTAIITGTSYSKVHHRWFAKIVPRFKYLKNRGISDAENYVRASELLKDGISDSILLYNNWRDTHGSPNPLQN